MSVVTSVSQTITLPLGLYSDEPPLETDLHLEQIILLLTSLKWLWQDRSDFYAAGNLTIYYNPQRLKNRDFRGPDFFVVLDTSPRSRRSWTLWEEGGQYPNLIVEVLSDSTASVDRTTKKELYQNIFRTPEYFWFDPVSLEFQGFMLVGGTYQPIAPNSQGYLWSEQLQLYLGIGNADLVRYFEADGTLVLTPMEAAKQEQLQKEQERLQKEQAYDRIAQLEAKLRQAGIDPDDA
jgi:Uma2 family endonuclease